MMKLATIAFCLGVAAAVSTPQEACKPSDGCCDFAGTWWNEHPQTEVGLPSHIFTQSNCSVSFYWPGCSSTMGTVSGDTFTSGTCTNFYDAKLTGKLMLKAEVWQNQTLDTLKWSNGAGWSRVSAK